MQLFKFFVRQTLSILKIVWVVTKHLRDHLLYFSLQKRIEDKKDIMYIY